MSSFKLYWGAVVPDQEMFSKKHEHLFGRAPFRDAILADHEPNSMVVFDGEAWRKLDFKAIQEAATNHEESDNPDYDNLFELSKVRNDPPG